MGAGFHGDPPGAPATGSSRLRAAVTAQGAPDPAGPGFRPRLATLLLAACMFMSGASGLVNEYILSTVASYILGNSIEQFSIIIATMMLMMGVGGFVQRFVGDRLLVEKFILLEVLLALLGGYAPLATYAAYGALEYFALVQFFFVAGIGFLIGFEIPVVMRINERYQRTLRANLASILSLDYLGSFAGAVVWTYLLLRTFPLTEISFLVAGANFAVAFAAFLYFDRHGLVRLRRTARVAMALTALILLFGWYHNRFWSLALEQRLYEDPIRFAETTTYQRIVITENRRSADLRLYINGNLQFASSDEFRYHELLVHPAMALAAGRARVLILGGGDGMALREVRKYPELSQVTLVDLDPEMTRIAATNEQLRRLNGEAFRDARVERVASGAVSAGGWRQLFQESGRQDAGGRDVSEKVADVRVLNLDADRFLAEVAGRQWEVVIVDFPDPNAVELAKLYSLEFYRKLRPLLAPGGMVAIQATSPYFAREAFLCIQRTVERAGFATLPYHEDIPSFGDWGWLLAWPGEEPAAALRARALQLTVPVPTRYLNRDTFARALVFPPGALTAEREEVNTLMHPVLLDMYTRQSWTNW